MSIGDERLEPMRPGDDVARFLDRIPRHTPPLASGAGMLANTVGGRRLLTPPPPTRPGQWIYIIAITGSAEVSPGVNRYHYAWKPLKKTAPGYGGFVDLEPGGTGGGTTGVNPARNFYEDGDDALTVGGVDMTGELVASTGVDAIACPAGQVVPATVVPVYSGGTVAYETWFWWAARAFDGTCDDA